MAKDRFHQVVKTALESDGWNVTRDPRIGANFTMEALKMAIALNDTR